MQHDAAHLNEPGLALLDITAANEDTARKIMDRLQQMWATSGITRIWRVPGEPCVRARVTPTSCSGDAGLCSQAWANLLHGWLAPVALGLPSCRRTSAPDQPSSQRGALAARQVCIAFQRSISSACQSLAGCRGTSWATGTVLPTPSR
ncbi:DUF6207 family protein [Streptomyces sp. NPDC023838]|uniref:DUF6207 family protein n=1 Tax=Streptomyces sp. NPDC023838 TaxID=3154325 RepID=UPI0033FD2C2F